MPRCRRGALGVILTLACLFALPAAASRATESAATTAASRATKSAATTSRAALTGPGWLTLNGPDGRLHAIYAAESAPLAGGTPEARARAFLTQWADSFGLPPATSDLQLESVRHDALGDHIRFRQTAYGRPVIGAEVDVHLLGDRAYMAVSSYRPVTVPAGPSFTAEEALQRIQQAARPSPVLRASAPSWPVSPDGAPELVVWPLSNEDAWAWRCPIRDAHGLPYTLLIDAEIGRHVRAIPRFQEIAATVYSENPISTPVREVRQLTGVDSSGYLKGPAADVVMGGTFGLRGITGGRRLPAGPNGFRYPPGDGRFAMANTFYHVNRVHDFYSGLGVGAVDYAMPVLMRFEDPSGVPFDNAMYDYEDGPRGSLVIGQGPDGQDFSLDGEVLYHEYTHFVLHQINQDFALGSDLEVDGLNEGFADFMAASLSGDPCIAEFLSPIIDGRACLRDLSTRRHYPEDTGETDAVDRKTGYVGFTESHVLGELIGGALWDLRNVLGTATADHLLLASVPLMNAMSTFPDVRAAFLEADRLTNGGAHAASIGQAFDARGIKDQAARYLQPDAFSSLRQRADVYIGPIYHDHITNDTLIFPGPIGATFAAGRTYPLSGFVGDEGAMSVTLKVIDKSGRTIDSMTQSQDISKSDVPDGDLGLPGRAFNLPLRFPRELAGQTVSLGLTFQIGSVRWTATARVDVVPEPGPSAALVPEPSVPAARLLGDADGNGALTPADAIAALRYALGLDPTDDARSLALDAAPENAEGTVGDDRVNLADVQMILHRMVFGPSHG